MGDDGFPAFLAGMMAGALVTFATMEDTPADAMRTVSVMVRSKIDTAILLAPEVAPSDVALACCVGE